MGDFEKDIQNAFEGAEFTPSPQVWDGVAAGLAPKKKVGVFYMWQTYGIAASIIFLFTMGFLFRDELFTVGGPGMSTEELSEDLKTETPAGNKETTTDNESDIITKNPTDDTPKENNNEAKVPPVQHDARQVESTDVLNRTELVDRVTNSDLSAQTSDVVNDDPSGLSSVDRSLEPVNEMNTIGKTRVVEELMDWLLLKDYTASLAEIRLRWELVHMVEPLPEDSTLQKRLAEPTIMARRTSLNGNFGSGSFSPNGSSSSEALSEDITSLSPNLSSFSVTNSDERQLGSLSIGGGIGIELGKKWVFKTGLRYSQYRYASTSNAYSLENGNPLPLNLNAAFDPSAVRYAGEYELTNTIHSISVPVQIGYRLLDLNKFDVLLNAGLGADFFVSYTVKGDLNFLETRKVDVGESEFLNRFNLNVLTGLEFGYALSDKFGLSADVFFRQYLPSLNKIEGVNQATPSFLGFGLGVNYFLRKKK